MEVLRKTNKGVRDQAQGEYEIFESLRIADMVI